MKRLLIPIFKFFALNRKESAGMVGFALLLFILILIKYYTVFHLQKLIHPIAVLNLDSAIGKFHRDKKMGEMYYDNKFLKFNNDTLFLFDPNLISLQEAGRLGFSEKLALRLMHFRQKGGRFKKNEDLLKLYGMPEELYQKLVKFVAIKSPGNFFPPTTSSFKKENMPIQRSIQFEINSGDSLAFMQILLIRPAVAGRIIKYRTKLGGFLSPVQLREVFGFPANFSEKMLSSLSADTLLVKKIKINTCDFKILARHPYIRYEGAKCIMQMRKTGTITPERIKNESCFDSSLQEKLIYYLDFSLA